MTKDEAWALVDPERWRAIHEMERALDAGETAEDRLRQLRTLMASRFVAEELQRVFGQPRSDSAGPVAAQAFAEPAGPDLRAVLVAVQGWLDASGLEAIFIGGVAVAAVARARYTEDVDLLAIMSDDTLAAIVPGLAEFGLELRSPEALGFAMRRGILALGHPGSGVTVDVLIADAPLQVEAVRAGVQEKAFGVTLRLPRVEDLLIMKALANRPLDQVDIALILERKRDVDLERVRKAVREVADSSAMPELIESLDRLIAGTH